MFKLFIIIINISGSPISVTSDVIDGIATQKECAGYASNVSNGVTWKGSLVVRAYCIKAE